MPTVSTTFSAVGLSPVLTVPPKQSVTYSATEDTFVGVAYFERSRNQGQTWEVIETATDASMTGGTVLNDRPADEWFRFRVTQKGVTAVSGTLACSVADVVDTLSEVRGPDGTVVLQITDAGIVTPQITPSGVVRTGRTLSINAAAQSKVGATAGWAVGAAADTALVTCPASQTAATLVLAVPSLRPGDTITGFYLVGQIESAGGTVTVDADLRKQTAAAADVADASVGAITQLSVTADTIMSSANTRKASLSEVVGVDETFYVLITATTAASTDIALQGVVLEITEA